MSTRYRGATRTERLRILDEFAAVTGYHRKHAIRLLSGWGDRENVMDSTQNQLSRVPQSDRPLELPQERGVVCHVHFVGQAFGESVAEEGELCWKLGDAVIRRRSVLAC